MAAAKRGWWGVKEERLFTIVVLIIDFIFCPKQRLNPIWGMFPSLTELQPAWKIKGIDKQSLKYDKIM